MFQLCARVSQTSYPKHPDFIDTAPISAYDAIIYGNGGIIMESILDALQIVLSIFAMIAVGMLLTQLKWIGEKEA